MTGATVLPKKLGALFVDLAKEVFLIGHTLNHGHVEGEVVGKDELQCLADDRHLLLLVVAVSSLEHLGKEDGALKVVIDKVLEAVVQVAVKIFGEQCRADTFHAGGQLGSVDLELRGGFMHRLNPVDAEAFVVSDEHLTGVNG